MEKNRRQTWRKQTHPSRGQVKRIDVLPDEVLLEIFYFYMKALAYPKVSKRRGAEAWQLLVHVCRRWRSLVFEAPRRLNLRLYCTPETPVRDTLDIWPALPLIVDDSMAHSFGTDNVIAALEQSNRICEVNLWNLVDWQLEEILVSMQVPFPELTKLRLRSYFKKLSVIPVPDSFLSGSAPCLQHLSFSGIPFPGLPKLLLSATHLVHLDLNDLPHSGYISPEAMVALLRTLSSLEILSLIFRSPQSRPDWEHRRPPPSTRSVIPALASLNFKGVTEYLEDLVTFIDTPHLDQMHVTFFNQINFDCPRLAQFIGYTPTLRACDEALVKFDGSTVSVALRYRWSGTQAHAYGLDRLRIDISCRESDWQLSSIEQVCKTLHPLSTVEELYIMPQYSDLDWKNDAIESTLWLELLLPFTAVKSLYVSREFEPSIAATLQELVSARIIEVLPSLREILVHISSPLEPFQKKIRQFVAARQLFGHPIAFSVWHHENDVRAR